MASEVEQPAALEVGEENAAAAVPWRRYPPRFVHAAEKKALCRRLRGRRRRKHHAAGRRVFM
jgi:hypothetical protein